MDSVLQGPTSRRGNEKQVARDDVVRAVSSVVEPENGPDGLPAERDLTALDASSEDLRCYFRVVLQGMSDAYGEGER